MASETPKSDESKLSPMAEFEISLKEAVRSKRLSQSKIEKATAAAMKCMEHDAKLVSILYRTHKSLQSSYKINSLYTFDALTRAARSHANKKKQVATEAADKGNCATFLVKLEGVLDSLVKDMLKNGPEEAKEKTKKVLEIWSKAGTFAPTVITRLMNRVEGTNGADQEPDVAALNSPPHSKESTPHPEAKTTPPVAVEDTQATLRALLSQAANAVGGEGAFTAALGAGQDLDPLQTALLHHLTQAAAASGNSSHIPSNQSTVAPNMVTAFGSFPSQSPSAGTYGQPQNFAPIVTAPFPAQLTSSLSTNQWNGPPTQMLQHINTQTHPPNQAPSVPHDPRRGSTPAIPRRDPRRPGGDDWAEKSNLTSDSRNLLITGERHFDDASGSRGGFRGPGRGRGVVRNWPNEGQRPRNRSRSKSPIRTPTGGHNSFGYNSPHRHMNDLSSGPSGGAGPARDEFGRDIPFMSSPAGDVPVPNPSSSAGVATMPNNPSTQVLSGQPASYNVPATIPDEGISNPTLPTSSMHTYDMSTFDFTAPASWLALGQAWKVANGTEPTQEQLMQCVMSGGQLLAPNQTHTSIPSNMGDNTQWNADVQVPVQQISVYGDGMQHSGMPSRGQHSGRGFRGANRGGGRGRGGFHGRNQWDEGWAADENEFVVGVQSNLTPANNNNPMNDEIQSLSGTGMRRIGDRWVFVRDGQVVS